MAKLFQNAPDLLADFQHFMPQGMLANLNAAGALEERDEREKSGRKKGDSSNTSLKRKRKQTEKEKEKDKESNVEKDRERDAPSKVGSSKVRGVFLMDD